MELEFATKVCSILWKVVHSILPVSVVLFRRNLVTNVVFSMRCSSELEFGEHLIWVFDFSIGNPLCVADWLSRWWKDVPDDNAVLESIAMMWSILVSA